MLNRRKYYDLFSHFYDTFVKLHSRKESSSNRSFLADMVEDRKGLFLDLCAGTGELSKMLAERGKRVVALDFSRGMLMKAKEKCQGKKVFFVVGDATNLPFKNGVFKVCTCSYAFYELKGLEGKRKALSEIKRVLENGGVFCMMEHEMPKNLLIKLLLYLRLATMGKSDVRVFLKKEMEIVGEFFSNVKKSITPSGKSKVICGVKK